MGGRDAGRHHEHLPPEADELTRQASPKAEQRRTVCKRQVPWRKKAAISMYNIAMAARISASAGGRDLPNGCLFRFKEVLLDKYASDIVV